MDEPPDNARSVALEEPRRCIDQRPNAWFLLILLCIALALVTYVALSAVGVKDQRALIASLLVLVVNLTLLSGLNCIRRRTNTERVDQARKDSDDELEENV